MENIQFRTWHKTRKRMSPPFTINGPNRIVMQFTGFSDYKGEMIFEGDIVKRKVQKSDYYPEQIMPKVPKHPETKRWVDTQIEVISMHPEVRFGNELICRELLTSKEIKEGQFASGWDYEVIGNIYEGKTK